MSDSRLIAAPSSIAGSTAEAVQTGHIPAGEGENQTLSGHEHGSPELSDTELLRRFIESADAVAFTSLVSRYERLVMGVALRQVGDRHRAEDVFQATFLVLAEQARRIRQRDSLPCWLHGTARRIGLRALNEQQRTRPMNDHTPEPTIDAPPLAEIQQAFERQALDDELAAMPEHLRLPLMLHYLDGLTAKEVAGRLEVTVETVEGRLKKGRSVLRERLMKHGIGFGVVLAAFQLSQQLASAAELTMASGFVVGVIGSTTGLASGGSSLATATAQSAIAWTQQQPLANCTANSVRLASQEIAAMTAAKGLVTLGVTAALCLTVGLGGALAWGQFGGGGGYDPTAKRGSRWVLNENIPAYSPSGYPGAASSDSDIVVGTNLVDVLKSQNAFNPAQALTGSADYRSLSASRSNVDAALDEGTLDIQFVDTPLEDVVTFLGEQLQVPIVVDRKALSDAGTNADEIKVTAAFDGLSRREALNQMLRSTNEDSLDYIVRDGVLTITTKDIADEFTEVVIYEVRHLGPNYPPQDIALLIESFTDGWEDYGHGQGNIRVIPGGVVVRQTQQAHREIRAFFKQLEQFAARTDLPAATRDPKVMELNGQIGPFRPDPVSDLDATKAPSPGFF